MSKRLAELAVLLPLLALLALALHGVWLRRAGGALEAQRTRYRTLSGLPLALGPAGRGARAGPGSHPAVEVERHAPTMLAPGRMR
ncbi:MAG: hypothetical protein CSA24_00605 [Deltaproteobacteria bacterium]|nr:MAG: hypothetical protein CSB49_06100 [Pseudomonadota bacterium]PIE66245.1 MAG: hypothetical protein CSA24_00605 [Deltaproteobacteria bacterium]